MSQIENRLRNMEYRCQEAAGEIERLLEENKRLLDRCISLVEGVERLREENKDLKAVARRMSNGKEVSDE